MTAESEQPPYPEWAQFIGAVVVLSSVVMIPLFLIVRLIGYQEARDEAMEFITRQMQSVRNFTRDVKRFIKIRYIFSLEGKIFTWTLMRHLQQLQLVSLLVVIRTVCPRSYSWTNTNPALPELGVNKY